MPARVLVTGGAGFIGSHLVKRLLEKGYHVRVLDNLSTGRIGNLSHILGRIEFQLGDVRDQEAVWRSLEGVDCVFHEAALVSVAESIKKPVEAFEINSRGTLNILQGSTQREVRRLVLASTSAAYGDISDEPAKEIAVPRPGSAYAASKVAAESLCCAFSNSYGLETVSLRYFNVYGPGQDSSSPYAAVVPRFIDAVLSGRRPVIYGDGKQTRDFVHIDDVVNANLLGMTFPHARGQAVNIAGGRSVSVNELVGIIGRLLHVPVRVVYESAMPGEIRHSMVDLSRAGEILGYAPQVSLEEGLRRLIAWWVGRTAWIPGDSARPLSMGYEAPASGGSPRPFDVSRLDRKASGG